MVFFGHRSEVSRKIFTFLKRREWHYFCCFFYFWQAVQGNLFDGTQMTLNDLPYLDPLQSAYSLLIIGLVFIWERKE